MVIPLSTEDFGEDRGMSESNLLINPLPTGWNNYTVR